MAIFNEMIDGKNSLSDADLLNIICSATEFENVKVRPEEMDEIDRLMKTQCALAVITPVEDFAGKCIYIKRKSQQFYFNFRHQLHCFKCRASC